MRQGRQRLAKTVLAALALAVAVRAAPRAGAAPDPSGGAVTGKVTLVRAGAPADAVEIVVYLVGFSEPPPATAAEVRQRRKRFVPELVPITAGQRVSFPNDDPFFHNVFSPSPARKFDLGQYPHGQTKDKRFPDVGVVEVFCNIHPEMAATILVLPNRRFARVGTDGSFRIDGVPPGRWRLFAYTRRAASPVSADVVITAGQATDVALSIAETRADFSHPNKYGEKYRDPTRYR